MNILVVVYIYWNFNFKKEFRSKVYLANLNIVTNKYKIVKILSEGINFLI